MFNYRLENWSVCSYPPDSDPYLAPELWAYHLQGRVYGHPGFVEGTFVITSSIKGKREDKILTHTGSHYQLGDVDPKYEEEYPDAKERLFNSLKEV